MCIRDSSNAYLDDQEDSHHDHEEHGEHAVKIRIGECGLGVDQRFAFQSATIDQRLILGSGGEVTDRSDDLLEVGGEGHGHIPNERNNRNPQVLLIAKLGHANGDQHEACGGKQLVGNTENRHHGVDTTIRIAHADPQQATPQGGCDQCGDDVARFPRRISELLQLAHVAQQLTNLITVSYTHLDVYKRQHSYVRLCAFILRHVVSS